MVMFYSTLNGGEVYVNPAHVVYICEHSNGNGTARIHTINGKEFGVSSTPAQVAAKLA